MVEANLSSNDAILQENSGGLVNFLLPNPTDVWEKYQGIKAKNQRTAGEALARQFINQYAIKTGVVGGVTSFGGLVTMLFLLPVDVAVSTRMEAELVYLVAFAKGMQPDDPDLPMMIYWILAGETAASAGKLTAQVALETLTSTKTTDVAVAGAKEIGKEVVMESGKGFYGKATKAFKNMGSKAGRRSAIKAGRNASRKAGAKIISKAAPKLFAKIFPVIGVVIGFVVNFVATRAVGTIADNWFNQLPDYYDQLDDVLPFDPPYESSQDLSSEVSAKVASSENAYD